MLDFNDETFLLSRRTMMLGGAAIGAAAALPMSAFATTPESAPLVPGGLPREGLLPADPAIRSAIFRRIRLRTDDGMVYWFFRGRNYAQQGANLIPLNELSFGAFMQITHREDGGMDVASFELGFRTNLDSGTRTDQIYNPITDQMVDVPFAPVGPLRVSYDAQNSVMLPEDIGGTRITVEHVPEVFYQLGDQICFQTHTRARAETPGQPDRVLNDMSLLTAPLSEALDPAVASANSWGYGGDVTDYARWLRMPEGSGSQTLRSVGQKHHIYEQMPQDWRDMLAATAPEIAADPVGALRGAPLEYRN
jgi:hypothetical protein